MLKEGNRGVAKGMREALRHKWLITRSSLIGVFIGAMPGLGPTPAHWIAYAQARQTEKGAVETFGTGTYGASSLPSRPTTPRMAGC